MLSGNTVKYIQSLTHKKFRDQHRQFIAETPKVVEEFLSAGYKPEVLYATEEWLKSAMGKIYAGKEKLIVIKDYELDKISQLKTARSVVGIFYIPDEMPPADLNGGITLALDDIQDPGNVGTIIRIADWFGVRHVLCSLHTANAYSPKVVQASMGSLAHVRIHYVELAPFIHNTHIPVYAAAMEGLPVFEMGRISEGILIIGNEGKGINEELLTAAKAHITIPRFGRAESLNAAMATGIILSHIVNIDK